MAQVGPPCSCFSTCNPITTREFLRSIPDSVTSRESPWYAYLRAVYGGDEVPLPYDLTRLRYIHHHDKVWQRMHPSVEWPMPPCTRLPNPLGGIPDGQWWAPMNWQVRLGIKPVRTRKCEPAACARWLSSAGYLRLIERPEGLEPTTRQPAQALEAAKMCACSDRRLPNIGLLSVQNPRLSCRFIELFAGPGNRTTRGTRWHYMTRGRNTDMPLPNGSWVEVMRTRARTVIFTLNA